MAILRKILKIVDCIRSIGFNWESLKTSQIATPLTFALIFIAPYSVAIATPDKLTSIQICTTGSDEQYYGEKGKPFTWQEIGERFNQELTAIGITVDFVIYPWKRCLRSIERNQVQGAALLIWNQERDGWIAFPKKDQKLDRSLSLDQVEYPIIYHKDVPVIVNQNRIMPTTGKVGAPIGYVVFEKLKSMNRLTTNNFTPEQGFKAVWKKVILGYALERKTAEAILRQPDYNLSPLRITEQYLLKEDLFIGLSKEFARNNPELSNAFWKVSSDFFQTLPKL